MASPIPITLVGENLGKRHLHLNSLVNEAYKQNEDFNIIKNLTEHSAIDRLFKIEYASKIENVEYIIQSLKDDDMLFVSKALKSRWLLETKYRDIINPQNLEASIFPEMITTAITKMQHWLHLNLKDESRCHEFYEHYYKKSVFDLAIKFLAKCSKDVIIKEFPNVKYEINTHYFKIFCQKCPQIIKIFYDLITDDEKLKNQYLNKETDYLLAMRHVLKVDTLFVLDIIEKYYNIHEFNRLSASQTKYIMTHHIQRFWKKPELYSIFLLNVQSVADNLSSDDAKRLLLKLVQAKYLANYNSFKSLEPFVKRVKSEERVEFKKKVFVTKDIGEEVEKWPYEVPAPPIPERSHIVTVFDDLQHEPYEYERFGRLVFKKGIMKRKGKVNNYCGIMSCQSEQLEDCCNIKVKTLLDKLFDEFRFASFGKSLYELRKRIAVESSPQNREFMILVLVSKSGGQPDNIALLLDLLSRHSNEPPNVRAAIIRSLVKRAYVWRLPEASWKQLLTFGQGLGLDGNTPQAECFEGLHAVIIRSLCYSRDCPSNIFNAFLEQFATLTDYTLNATEKIQIKESLPKLLLCVAKEKVKIKEAVDCINKLIDTLNAYKIRIESYPGLIELVVQISENNITEISCILNKLFQAKVARKQLFRYNFELVISDASYTNALKHDTTVLDGYKFSEYYKTKQITRADMFLKKLSVYFAETNGMGNSFLNCLKADLSHKHIGRPLAYLLGSQLHGFLKELDTVENQKSKLVSAAIRANAHLSKPTIDIYSIGLNKAGAKLIANIILKCRYVDLDKTIDILLKTKHTSRLALILSKRTSYETEVFKKLAIIRPTIAIKSGLTLMKVYGENFDTNIWETMKPIIQELDVTKLDKCHLIRTLAEIYEVPLKIRPEYSSIIYILFKKINFFKSMAPLCHIEILLSDVNEQFVDNLIQHFLIEDFNPEKQSKEISNIKCTCLFIRILIKYILLSKTDDVQKYKIETFLNPFLDKLEDIKQCQEKEALFSKYLHEIIITLKYNRVFLNTEYVSSMAVMEKVVIWMHNIFTVNEHFNTFAFIHLSMLYFNAVRQALKFAPEIFADEKRKRNDGVKIVGRIFGKYVAKEVNILTSKYFDSIIELYHESLIHYLDSTNFESNWLLSIIKGILEESEGSEYRMGIYLFAEKKYYLEEEHIQDIKSHLNTMTNKDIQWFTFNYAL